MKNKILLSIFTLFLLINNVSGDSIEISNQYQKQYSTSDTVSGNSFNMSKIYFDTTNYNYFDDFRINASGMPFQQLHFSHSFESTTGSIISGGSGEVIGYYDSSSASVYLVCVSVCNIISSPFIIEYDKNIWVNVTSHPVFAFLSNNNAPNINSPLAIYSNSVTNPYLAFYYRVNLHSGVTDTFNVTYLTNNLFNIEVIKGKNLPTKWFINSSTGTYSYESTFNILDFSFTDYYADGLKIAVTLSAGGVSELTLNTSGYVSSDYTLTANKTFYNLGEQINISYLIQNADTTNYNYFVKLYDGNTEWVSTKNAYDLDNFWLPIHDKSIMQIFTAYITRSPKNNSALSEYMDMLQIEYGFASDVSTQTGNLSTDKNIYNQSENIIINYNASMNAKLHLFNGFNDYLYDVPYGLSQTYNFLIPENEKLGLLNIELYIFDGVDYNTLDSITVLINPINSNNELFFENDNIEQGRTYYIDGFLNQTGYILIKNPDGVLKFNFSIPSNTLSQFQYMFSFNDDEGIYTGYLYNSSGTLFDSDSVYLNGGIVTPKPTINNTVSIVDNPFIFTDDDGEVSDVMIKRRGNQWFSFIFAVCMLCLCAGAYWKMRGK